MGTSADAILGYGYVWDKDGPHNTYEWVEKLNEKYPLCNAGVHCYMDNPMFYISVKRLEVKAYRGYPKKLGVLLYPTHEELLQLVELYKEVFPIYKEEVPEQVTFDYFICSYWG